MINVNDLSQQDINFLKNLKSQGVSSESALRRLEDVSPNFQRNTDLSATAIKDQKIRALQGEGGMSRIKAPQPPEQSGFAGRTLESAKESFVSGVERGAEGVREVGRGFKAGATGEVKPTEAFEQIGKGLTEFGAGTAEGAFGPLVAPVVGGLEPQIQAGLETFIETRTPEQLERLQTGIEQLKELSNKIDPNLKTGLLSLLEFTGAKGATVLEEKFGKKVISEAPELFKKARGAVSDIKARFTKADGSIIEIPTKGEIPSKVSETITDLPAVPKPVKQKIDDTVDKLLFADLKDPTDITFRAIKPRIKKGTNLKKAKENLTKANQVIVQQGFRPKNVKEYADAIDQSKRKIWSQIESTMEEQGLDSNIDLTDVAVRLLEKADDPALSRVNPKAVGQIQEFADNLVRAGGEINIVEAERIKQLLNADLDGAFGATDLSKPLQEAMKDVTSDIGKQLDSVLSKVPGEFADLKNQYGALRSIEDDVVKRMIVFERQNPEDLISSLTKIQAAGDIVLGSTKERAKAVQRLGVSKIIKDRNDANKLVERAFNLID